MTTIDLHIHTNCSDGQYTPYEIIDIALNNGVSTLSIADHDTILAYTDNLFNYAKEKNINIIPGVEISTNYLGVGIHVLGYNFDLNNKELIDCLSKLKNARLDYLINVSKLLNKLGYYINLEKLKELNTVTKAHIALDIITNKQNEDLLIKTFNHIPSKGEFIETIMNEGCPAYTKKFTITPIEASKIIKNANGKVILAHPIAYTHEDNISLSQIDTLIEKMNADGIESNYLYVDKDNILFDECDFWNNYAKEKNLITTIGSDFHNIDRHHPEIGFIKNNFSLTNNQVDTIIKNLLSK